MMMRALYGAFAAACVSIVALGARSLTAGGAIAATMVGTLAVAVDWSWGALLIAYFASSSALSRVGRSSKEIRTASVVAKGGARDAVQVLANGGIFAGAAAAMLVRPDVRWIALGAGALAASAADTWATEIGTLWGGTPRSITSGRAVPAGTSGGVTLIGSVAAIAGAIFVGAAVAALDWTWSMAIHVAIGGVAGTVLDSLLGATVQSRRWCESCRRATEREMHDCGSLTRAQGGFDWMDNDIVNFLSTVSGGLVAAFLSR